MANENQCVICKRSFSLTNTPWLIPMCGHSICNHCLRAGIAQNTQTLYCSVCRKNYNLKKHSLQEFNKNTTILKYLKESKS
jgi:hypothetical protein